MAKLIVVTFPCPYRECVWPRCRHAESINRPLCGDEIDAAKDKITRQYAFRPRRLRSTAKGQR